MKVAKFFLFLVLFSFVLAFLEVQVEGKAGWAGNLPTWRVESGWFVQYLWGGRPLTGYHVSMITFLLLAFHFPFVFIKWSWRTEMLVWGLFLAMWPLEDFLWFVLNPAYGLAKFGPEYIWWHKSWFGPVPTCYYGYFAVCIPMLYFGLQVLRRSNTHNV